MSEKQFTPTKKLLNEQKLARRATHEQYFQKVKQLFAEGTPILQIARQLKMSRNTVKKFLKYESVPPSRQSPRNRCSPIHRFVPYLRQRWMQGERNARRLWEEVKAHGYSGAQETLRHFLQKWRDNSGDKVPPQAALKTSAGRAPSVRRVKWLLFGKQQKTEDWENSFLDQLLQNNREIAVAQALTKESHQTLMSRQEQTQTLKKWLEKVRASGIAEFICFANGIESDRAAVESAHLSEWSQGQVEGQVNRLKFIKRQIYGRGSFDELVSKVVEIEKMKK